jgi:hypothetical protein
MKAEQWREILSNAAAGALAGGLLAALGSVVGGSTLGVVSALGVGGLIGLCGGLSGAGLGLLLGGLVAALGSVIGGGVLGVSATVLGCALLAGWLEWKLSGPRMHPPGWHPRHWAANRQRELPSAGEPAA